MKEEIIIKIIILIRLTDLQWMVWNNYIIQMPMYIRYLVQMKKKIRMTMEMF
jgi:hypothetical protein